jgi:hypothetical protein
MTTTTISLLFQVSWGRLEMKQHGPKKYGQNKRKKEGKQMVTKNEIEK